MAPMMVLFAAAKTIVDCVASKVAKVLKVALTIIPQEPAPPPRNAQKTGVVGQGDNGGGNVI